MAQAWGPGAEGGEAGLVVRELWAALEELAGGQERACQPGCDACCTDRVLLTWAEGELLAAHLRATGEGELLRRVAESTVQAGARPATTFNALARLCLSGQEPAEEQAPPPPGVCPLLRQGLCRAYAARPLACRVMASRRRCQAGGWADQDPWWVTLGAVFFQLVEQASAGRPFGLMAEVLAEVVAKGEGGGRPGLLACENLPGIIAPPEHQARLTELLKGLFQRPCGGEPLGQRMERLRSPQPGPT